LYVFIAFVVVINGGSCDRFGCNFEEQCFEVFVAEFCLGGGFIELSFAEGGGFAGRGFRYF
jgi:hypothetical protein